MYNYNKLQEMFEMAFHYPSRYTLEYDEPSVTNSVTCIPNTSFQHFFIIEKPRCIISIDRNLRVWGQAVLEVKQLVLLCLSHLIGFVSSNIACVQLDGMDCYSTEYLKQVPGQVVIKIYYYFIIPTHRLILIGSWCLSWVILWGIE